MIKVQVKLLGDRLEQAQSVLRLLPRAPVRDFISCRYSIVLILHTQPRQDPIFFALDST